MGMYGVRVRSLGFGLKGVAPGGAARRTPRSPMKVREAETGVPCGQGRPA